MDIGTKGAPGRLLDAKELEAPGGGATLPEPDDETRTDPVGDVGGGGGAPVDHSNP